MSIASEITRLQTAKADLKTAIEGKGVTVDSSATLDDYPTLVNSIQTGGGGGSSIEDKVAQYPGVVFGAGFSASILEKVFVATPFLEIPSNCTSITIHFTNTANKGLYGPRHILYNANKGFASYWNQTNSASEFTKTMTAGAYAYLRVTLDCDLIDDSFVKDNTNNQYLWKGKNIT